MDPTRTLITAALLGCSALANAANWESTDRLARAAERAARGENKQTQRERYRARHCRRHPVQAPCHQSVSDTVAGLENVIS